MSTILLYIAKQNALTFRRFIIYIMHQNKQLLCNNDENVHRHAVKGEKVKLLES